MTITFPSNTADIIDEIRGVIGRPVTFYQKYNSTCPTCGIDPITGDALDSWCPTCSGIGSLVTWSGTTITGHVIHGQVENFQWATGGKYFDGDSTAQIKYTNMNLTTVDNTDYLVADNLKFTIKRRIYRGAPALNRIILVLKEKAER